MAKKKKKTDLVLVGAMVTPVTAEALKLVAKADDRSVSKVIKKLIDESPDVQGAIKQVSAA